MKAGSELELLTRYSRDGEESAFAVLVRSQLDWVYSAARRIVVDPHLAEDVAQSVFVALARESGAVVRRMRGGMPLSAWLHRTTRNVAAKTVRAEERRRAREHQFVMNPDSPEASGGEGASWDALAPHLDAAIADLPDPDRDALLLRFFERRTSREIGNCLGIGEEAAQKRVTRAMERLRGGLEARGVAVSAAALSGSLAAQAVQSAPAGLASTIQALTSGISVAGAGGVLGWLSPKVVAVGSGWVAAGLAVTVAWQAREQRILRAELARVPASVEVASAIPTPVSPANAGEHAELLRLRGEVARLIRERDALKALAFRPNPVSAGGGEPILGTGPADYEAFKADGIRKLNESKNWVLACMQYADAHGDRYPDSLGEASEFLDAASVASGDNGDRYELVYHGSLAEVSNPSRVIVLREKEPFQNFGRPGFSRTYGFLDGHAEIHSQDDGNFEAWESERTAVPRAPEAVVRGTSP
ncbi:MAG: sigma-70 family RNA polymerase sigma factor [Verrucomicrobiales bacterium]|nr:sigma-70 family RNA polymerase sigma factor [Verrucomicrobiales bacterium]